MSTIRAYDGTEIYSKDWGKGPVVMFSHGWPLCSDAWVPRAERLPRSRARSSRPWPFEPGLFRQRHGRLIAIAFLGLAPCRPASAAAMKES